MPQGNSNPCFLREREMSSASRRWGLCLASAIFPVRYHTSIFAVQPLTTQFGMDECALCCTKDTRQIYIKLI